MYDRTINKNVFNESMSIKRSACASQQHRRAIAKLKRHLPRIFRKHAPFVDMCMNSTNLTAPGHRLEGIQLSRSTRLLFSLYPRVHKVWPGSCNAPQQISLTPYKIYTYSKSASTLESNQACPPVRVSVYKVWPGSCNAPQQISLTPYSIYTQNHHQYWNQTRPVRVSASSSASYRNNQPK